MDDLDKLRERMIAEGLVPAATAKDLLTRYRNQFPTENQSLQDFVQRLVAEQHLTPLAGEALLMKIPPPYELGEYRLTNLKVVGVLGNIFQALHLPSGNFVCLKLFPPTLDPLSLPRMQREARVSILLDHPHVVHTLQATRLGDFTALILEHLKGKTLSTLLHEREKLPYREAVRLIWMAAKGVAYLHERNVLHRDLQPGNLWLTEEDILKVLEFSAARDELEYLDASDSGVGLTALGSGMVGTYDYMAPEQGQDTQSADERSDLYSLGCVLYHCLTGLPPFADINPVRQMLRHAKEPPRSLMELGANLPPELEALVLTLLAKDPANRVQTADDLAFLLQPFLPTDFLAEVTREKPSARAKPQIDAFRMERRGNVTIVTPAQKDLFDRELADLCIRTLSNISRNVDTDLVLDLQPIAYMASPGLGVLLNLETVLKIQNRTLCLTGVSTTLQEVLKITKIDEVIHTEPTVDEAVTWLNSL